MLFVCFYSESGHSSSRLNHGAHYIDITNTLIMIKMGKLNQLNV